MYNMEQFLDYSLNSIIKQNHQELEIIIVDDGSTDNSVNIVSSINDSRIKLILNNHLGRSAAINTGLSHATGEFIHIFDLDDFISRDFYKNAIEHLDEDVDIIVTAHQVVKQFYDYGKLVFESPITLEKTNILEQFLSNRFITTAQWNKIYKREIVQFLPENIINDDLYITTRYFVNAKKVVLTKNSCYYHVFRPGSMSRSEFKLDFIIENIDFRLNNFNIIIENCVSQKTINYSLNNIISATTYFVIKLFILDSKNPKLVLSIHQLEKYIRSYKINLLIDILLILKFYLFKLVLVVVTKINHPIVLRLITLLVKKYELRKKKKI